MKKKSALFPLLIIPRRHREGERTRLDLVSEMGINRVAAAGPGVSSLEMLSLSESLMNINERREEEINLADPQMAASVTI